MSNGHPRLANRLRAQIARERRRSFEVSFLDLGAVSDWRANRASAREDLLRIPVSHAQRLEDGPARDESAGMSVLDGPQGSGRESGALRKLVTGQVQRFPELANSIRPATLRGIGHELSSAPDALPVPVHFSLARRVLSMHFGRNACAADSCSHRYAERKHPIRVGGIHSIHTRFCGSAWGYSGDLRTIDGRYSRSLAGRANTVPSRRQKGGMRGDFSRTGG